MSGGVNGYDSATDVAQDVLGLQSHRAQVGGECCASGARRARARGDVSGAQRDASKYSQLQPVSEIQRRSMREDDVGEVEDTSDRSDEEPSRCSQPQGGGGQ